MFPSRRNAWYNRTDIRANVQQTKGRHPMPAQEERLSAIDQNLAQLQAETTNRYQDSVMQYTITKALAENTIGRVAMMHEEMNQRFNSVRTALDVHFEATNAHFDLLQKHADKTDKRLDSIEAQLTDHTARFDRVETRLDGVETRLDRVETRLNGVETRLDRVETRLNGVETRLTDHTARFGRVEALLTQILARLPEKPN